MIKIDVSKAIPKRLGTHLLGAVPGMVFELTVAFREQMMDRKMIDRVTRITSHSKLGKFLRVGQISV